MEQQSKVMRFILYDQHSNVIPFLLINLHIMNEEGKGELDFFDIKG